MKFISNKKVYLFAGSILLLLLLVLPIKSYFMNVEASSNEYQIRMLEVTENGSSELASLKSGLSNLTIDTMSMKRFVALRDDMDGKYDAIYIGKGTYSPAQVSNQASSSTENRARALDTRAVKNDITELKAKQIKEEFIDKGLLVIFNSQPFSNPLQIEQGNLYKFFNGYNSASKSNVKFVNDAGLTAIINDLKSKTSTYIDFLQQRPRLQITNRSEIIDYNPSLSNQKIYQPGDKLTFDFNITHAINSQNNPISVKLYLGSDKSITMGQQQVVAEQELSTPSGTLEYTLPRTYSGVLYWKLEINDYHSLTQLKDFTTGSIRYRGEKTIVNILQVIPDSGVNSSLKLSSNMSQQLLQSDDYQLNITVKNAKDFNSYVKQNYDLTKKYGLNGTYQMLIFGFQDEYYKKASLDAYGTAAVTQFINDFKQSVLFTHDTVINLDPNNRSWVNNFKTITGQRDPETNLGHYAANLSTNVKPVNDGLLMQYPNYLSKRDESNNQINISTPKIAPTHNQYFTLDLNNPEVIPWYNIQSEPSGTQIKNNETEHNEYQRDTEDSWNQYYTYSKGNVTYSGTGHFLGVSNIKAEQMNFPLWEQQLFVNTMYRAFIGANHPPEITVNTPVSGSSIPSYQNKLLVDYTVTDLDLNDRDLTTEIRFKQGDKYLSDKGLSKKAIKSGHNIHETFPNPLPDGGTLDIEINAWDSHGALSTQTVTVIIVKSTPNLSISRSLSPNALSGIVAKGEEVTIYYSVTPQAVPFDTVSVANSAFSKQVISDIKFEEKLPPDLDISGELPTGMSKSGSLAEGYTLTRDLGSISYSFTTEGGKKIYIPDSIQPILFEVTVTPQQTGMYTLNNSNLSYVDIHATSTTVLGLAGQYNAFILGSTNINEGSINHSIASGGNLSLNHIYINTNKKDLPYAVVAGNNLEFPEGTINGDVRFGGNFEKKQQGYIIGDYRLGSPINFLEEGKYLNNLSATLASKSANGTDNIEFSALVLQGTNTGTNIFSIDGEKFNKVNELKILAPAGSFLIINIFGDSVTLNGGFNLSSELKGDKILLNFPNAKKLALQNMNIYGSILAPQAAISFTGGQVHGNLIGSSLIGKPTLPYDQPFNGEFPNPTPPPTNMARTTISFETLSFKAEYKIKELSLESRTIYVGDKIRLIPAVTPSDLSHSLFHWTTSNPSVVQIDASSGDIVGMSKGTAEVIVSALDESGKFAKATITVEERTLRSLAISGKGTGAIKEYIPLSAIYIKNNLESETSLAYTWTVRNADPFGAGTASILANPDFPDDTSKKYFSADQSGEYIVELTLNSSHPTSLTAEKLIIITNPLTSLAIEGPTTVLVGESIDLRAIKTPADADALPLSWSFVQSEGDTFAGLQTSDNGARAQLTAKLTAKEELKIKVTDGNKSAIHTVNIVDLTGLRFKDQSLTLNVGDTRSLMSDLWVFPTSIQPDSIKHKLSWESNSPSIVSVNNGTDVNLKGIVTALKKGSAIVTVTYNSGVTGRPSIKGYISIEVLDRPNGDRY